MIVARRHRLKSGEKAATSVKDAAWHKWVARAGFQGAEEEHRHCHHRESEQTESIGRCNG